MDLNTSRMNHIIQIKHLNWFQRNRASEMNMQIVSAYKYSFNLFSLADTFFEILGTLVEVYNSYKAIPSLCLIPSPFLIFGMTIDPKKPYLLVVMWWTWLELDGIDPF